MAILMYIKTFAKEVQCFYLQKLGIFTFAHNFNSWPIVDFSSILTNFCWFARGGLVGTFQSPSRQIVGFELTLRIFNLGPASTPPPAKKRLLLILQTVYFLQRTTKERRLFIIHLLLIHRSWSRFFRKLWLSKACCKYCSNTVGKKKMRTFGRKRKIPDRKRGSIAKYIVAVHCISIKATWQKRKIYIQSRVSPEFLPKLHAYIQWCVYCCRLRGKSRSVAEEKVEETEEEEKRRWWRW